MRITGIEWDDDTIAHIGRHGVEPEEVEDIFFKMNPLTLKARQGRYLALGQAEGGRYLTIVFQRLGQNKAEIVTARAMSEAERSIYKRR